MEALVFDKVTSKLTYHKDYPIPDLKLDSDILVKVEYSGVCGTDLHIIEGAFPCNDKNPFVLGHEFCGTIVKAGPKSHYKAGDRVVVDPNSGCGVCINCHNAQYHMCEEGGLNTTLGIWQNGGWAEYARVPENQALILPKEISTMHGGLCEPVSCISRGWDRVSPVPVGSRILIMGAGIIGNLWTALFHLQGHKHVTISEPNEERRKTSNRMALGYACLRPDEISSKKMLFDVIVDCTGVAAAMESSLPMLKPCGKYVIFGCANPTAFAKIAPFEIFRKESTILGVNVNPFTFPKAIGFLESLGDKYLDYEKLGIKMFKLSQYDEAFKQLHKGDIAKAMFKFSS